MVENGKIAILKRHCFRQFNVPRTWRPTWSNTKRMWRISTTRSANTCTTSVNTKVRNHHTPWTWRATPRIRSTKLAALDYNKNTTYEFTKWTSEFVWNPVNKNQTSNPTRNDVPNSIEISKIEFEASLA